MKRSLLPLLVAGLAVGTPEYMAPELLWPAPRTARKPRRPATPPHVSTPAERLDFDALICAALGKRPGESIVEAATRALGARNSDAWKVATVVLHPRPYEEPWAVMRRAAKVARRIGAAS